ncbi:hypothetical protein [Mesomycoplasma ovipneumoniae]|uniref:hypothetical protein n=1 Tax=Mesomycoplasma ovipneumoniae TaxID=29562 RepID=UPI00083E944F|nr:hypothetical protein [Mesomycoplasma ovipneumoniae]
MLKIQKEKNYGNSRVSPWVSQFVEVILKKHRVLGAFLIFLAKLNYNFFTDLLKYQSKNHTYFKYLDHKIMNTAAEKITKALHSKSLIKN